MRTDRITESIVRTEKKSVGARSVRRASSSSHDGDDDASGLKNEGKARKFMMRE